MNKAIIAKTFRKSIRCIKHYSPTILTWFGVTGVVVTAVMSAKAHLKAVDTIFLHEEGNYDPEHPEIDNYVELDFKEKIKLTWKIYLPPVIMGMATISCIVAANSINQKRQAALVSAYSLSAKALEEYKNKIKEEFGEEKSQDIQKAIVEDKGVPEKKDPKKDLFYDSFGGRFFESTFEDVVSAEYYLNREFATQGLVSLNQFYMYLGIEETPAGNVVGWSIDQFNEMGVDYWLDFQNRWVEDKEANKKYVYIDYAWDPTIEYDKEF